MKHETMSPRERWEAVLSRKQPDRIPFDWWGTIEVEKKIKTFLKLDNIDRKSTRLNSSHIPLSRMPSSA